MTANVDATDQPLGFDSPTPSEDPAAHVLAEHPPAGARRRTGKTTPHSSPAESAARGKAARAEVPRSAHGAWEPAPLAGEIRSVSSKRTSTAPAAGSRPRSATGRMLCLAVHVLPWRCVSDGSRSRGRAADRCLRRSSAAMAHLSNFGIFAAPDRRLVFSINDFDGTLPGPFEWDVKRLAASFAIAGRDQGFDGAAAARPSPRLPASIDRR